MRTMLLTLLLLPSIAFAEPGECTVTTTVKCTGDAAPYAIEAAKPQPPVVVQPPAPPPPPPVAAPPMLPPPVYLLDPQQLHDGWHITQSSDGCLWRERKVSTGSPAVWGTGLALWMGGYFAAGIGATQGDGNFFGWWPIVGAFVNSGISTGSAQALWAVDGIAQAGGFVMFLVGLAAGPDKIERRPLTITPMALYGGGSGVALTGRF